MNITGLKIPTGGRKHVSLTECVFQFRVRTATTVISFQSLANQEKFTRKRENARERDTRRTPSKTMENEFTTNQERSIGKREDQLIGTDVRRGPSNVAGTVIRF